MQQKFIHCLWSQGEVDRKGSNILYLVPRKYKSVSSRGPCSKHKVLIWVFTKVAPDSQESKPSREHPSLVMQLGHLRICHCSPAKEHIVALGQLPCRWSIKTHLCFLTLPSLSGHCSFSIEWTCWFKFLPPLPHLYMLNGLK